MKITKFKHIDNPGSSLIASFDADIGPVTIRKMSVFEKDGRCWISEPSEKWTDRDGGVRFQKHVIITDQETMGELARLVKEQLHAGAIGTSDDIPY